MNRTFGINDCIRSFKYAFSGLFHLVRSQHNAWIHLAATNQIVPIGLYFRLNSIEWCLLVLAMTLVWATEALNTAVELLADAATSEFHPLIGRAKDVAAAAVLVAAIGASIIGLIVFLPHICS
jgi:diacylglycerol kinase